MANGLIMCLPDRKPSSERPYSTEESLWLVILLEMTRDAMRKVRQIDLDQFNMHPRRYTLLWVCKDIGDRATPVEISRRLRRARHSVSVLLNKMEKGGLLKKHKDLDRKNMVRVVLTKKGLQLTQQASKLESIHQTMASLSKTKRRQLKIYLETIRDQALKELALERSVPHIVTEDKDYNLYLLLIETTDEILKLWQKELNRYGLHYRRAVILLVLRYIHDRAISSEIARRLFRERNSISELLNKMERDGQLKKIQDMEKGNMVRFMLTKKGQKAFHQSSEGDSVRKILSVFSETDRKNLKSYLRALYHEALKTLGINNELSFPPF